MFQNRATAIRLSDGKTLWDQRLNDELASEAVALAGDSSRVLRHRRGSGDPGCFDRSDPGRGGRRHRTRGGCREIEGDAVRAMTGPSGTTAVIAADPEAWFPNSLFVLEKDGTLRQVGVGAVPWWQISID